MLKTNLIMTLAATMLFPSEQKEDSTPNDDSTPDEDKKVLNLDYEDWGEKFEDKFKKLELNLDKFDVPSLSPIPNKKKKKDKDWRKSSPFKKKDKRFK